MEDDQDQEQQQVDSIPTEEEEQLETRAPIKSVKTFWERLDEVLNQNTQLRERMEELVDQFPDNQQVNQTVYKSFMFQPDRLAISSGDDISRVTTQPGNLAIDLSGVGNKTGPYNEQYFNNYRIRLDKGLVNVKSMQLISCVIPNIVPSIPNYSLGFFYYRLRTLEGSQLPNWNATTTYSINDYVFYPRVGLGYQAAGTSKGIPPNTDITKWKQIANYDNSANYIPGNIVYQPSDFSFYQCILATTGHAPTNPTYWKRLGEYVSTIVYNRNDIVQSTINYVYYVCITNGTFGQEPSTSSNFTFLTNTGGDPNYFDLTPDFINVIYLNPTTGYTYDMNVVVQQTYNRRFIDYDDLLTTLNLCATTAGNCAGAAPTNTIEFLLTRANSDPSAPIFFQVQKVAPPSDRTYFILPCGYADPNIATFVANIPTIVNVDNKRLAPIFAQNFKAQYILNTRLGFTWNGIFTSPYLINPYTNFAQSCGAAIYFFLRPTYSTNDFQTLLIRRTITANTSADLVYTSCVRVYADFVFGSSQDSEGNGGLLSVIPVNTANNGVGFYQNNFNNPLSKIPKLITEIGISLTDDQGLPYSLPNSATVLIELGVVYF